MPACRRFRDQRRAKKKTAMKRQTTPAVPTPMPILRPVCDGADGAVLALEVDVGEAVLPVVAAALPERVDVIVLPTEFVVAMILLSATPDGAANEAVMGV